MVALEIAVCNKPFIYGLLIINNQHERFRNPSTVAKENNAAVGYQIKTSINSPNFVPWHLPQAIHDVCVFS